MLIGDVSEAFCVIVFKTEKRSLINMYICNNYN